MSQDFDARHAIAIRTALEQAFEGMRVLGDAQLIQPLLVVLYSTMDTAAWLAAEHDGDVTRADFVTWVERFVLPESGLECSALDLYAARCGILHSASAYSSLHRIGKARLISYAGGPNGAADLKRLLRTRGIGDMVVVHPGELANALLKGWTRFVSTVETNPDAIRRLNMRAGDLFSMVGSARVQRALENDRGTGT